METLDRGKGLWSGTSYKFQLAGEHQVNTTTTWNRKATLEAGFETTMKAGVLIASAEVKTSLKVGGQFDKGGSNSKTQLLKWNIEKQINGPDDAVEYVPFPRIRHMSRVLIGTSQRYRDILVWDSQRGLQGHVEHRASRWRALLSPH
jgi:hypothetical protein